MKAHITYLLILALAVLNSNAQTFLGGSIIQTNPVGKFGKKSLNMDAGMADPGLSLGIAFNHFFKENLGYGISFDFGNNPIDEQTWEDLMREAGAENPSIGTFDYEIFNLYGSFYAKLKLIKNVEIQSAVNLGIMNVNYPAVSYSDKTIDSLYSAVLFSEGGDGAAILLGGELALSYTLNKFKFQFATDYIYGRPKFNAYNAPNQENSLTLDVGILRPSIKLFYKL